MGQYSGAIYNIGTEGYHAFGFETTAIAPDTVTLPAAPSLTLVGFGTVPSTSRSKGKSQVAPVGSYKPLGKRRGAKQVSVNGTIQLGDGAGAKTYFQAALRPGTGLTGAAKSLCLPYFCLGFGAVGACDVTRSIGFLVRYALMNTLTLSITPDAGAVITYQAMAIAKQDFTAALTTSVVNDAAIEASSGELFNWDDLSVTIGATDYRPIISGVTLTVNNNVSFTPMHRGRLSGGEANPLTHAPNDVQPGGEVIGLSLALAAPFPSTLTDFSTIIVKLDNGTHSHTFTLSGCEDADDGNSEVDNSGRFGYSISFLVEGMTYVYA